MKAKKKNLCVVPKCGAEIKDEHLMCWKHWIQTPEFVRAQLHGYYIQGKGWPFKDPPIGFKEMLTCALTKIEYLAREEANRGKT